MSSKLHTIATAIYLKNRGWKRRKPCIKRPKVEWHHTSGVIVHSMSHAIIEQKKMERLDHQMKHGPCMECGATSADDPDPKHRCHCAGDKDHCHGCDIWPDA